MSADVSKWKLMPSDHTWLIPICPYCGLLLAHDPETGDWLPSEWNQRHDHSDVHDPSIQITPKFVRVRELARGEGLEAKAELERVRDWLRRQQQLCSPPELADAPGEEADEARGPCAVYGALVWGLAADKLDSLLAGKRPFFLSTAESTVDRESAAARGQREGGNDG